METKQTNTTTQHAKNVRQLAWYAIRDRVRDDLDLDVDSIVYSVCEELDRWCRDVPEEDERLSQGQLEMMADDNLTQAILSEALNGGPKVRIEDFRSLSEVIGDLQARDDDWQREQAMQAGMAFGCDGYNDMMGY